MRRSFFLWLGLSLGLNLLAGLMAFYLATEKISRQSDKTSIKADGIVVLTGGSGERIKKAAEIYQGKTGIRLLVSGVNPKVSQADLIRLSGLQGSDFNCCVDLDVQALNTSGNARQISIWARSHGYQNLLVVTSSYHMPRALLEMQKADADLNLIPFAVSGTGIAKPVVARRTVVEYAKYLVVLLRGLPRSQAKAGVK